MGTDLLFFSNFGVDSHLQGSTSSASACLQPGRCRIDLLSRIAFSLESFRMGSAADASL